MASEIKVDTISEKTSANGIAIDSVTLKDGGATLTAPLILADGSASAPTITNTGDTNCGLLFSAADTMAFSAGGTSQFTMADGVIAPVTDNDVDLGTSSLEFKDGYFDGTLYCDTLNLAGTNHTSISSPITALNNATANELVTVASTTTELDAESGMTYNGDQLVLSFGTGDAKKFLSIKTADDAVTDISGHRYYGSDDNDHSVINNAGGGGMQLDIGGVANSAENTALLITDAKKIATGGEGAPDVDAGGITLDQNALDSYILTLKSSDIAHGMTDQGETDTYCSFLKQGATTGGVLLKTFTEDERSFEHEAFFTNENTTKSTSGNGVWQVRAREKSGSSGGTLTSNANIMCVKNDGSTKFIVDAEGELHSDGGAQSAYDEYDDAQLIRACDLSKGKGVIDSKFDKFIAYNHEHLADLKLVGREEDGTPNHFINVTGMQRLHNGAIWQQYEKHNQLLEAVYDLAKEAVGEEKANAILDKHEVKRLQ